MNWLPRQRPFGYHKTYNHHVYAYQISKNWRGLVQYSLRYLVGYADFCRLVSKITVILFVMSGVSGLILIKLAQNVARILTFDTCKSELRYSNPFRNVSLLNEDHFANFAKNWLPWQFQLRNWKKKSRSTNYKQIPTIW